MKILNCKPARLKDYPARMTLSGWSHSGWLKIMLAVSFLFFVANTTHASTIARPILNSGLVGYWSMEEGTGRQTFDRSGSGNTGTLTNMNIGNAWVNGATSTGQALRFDGTDDYLEMGDINLMDGLTQSTVGTWVKLPSGSLTAEEIFVSKAHCDGGTDNGPFQLGGGNHLPYIAFYKSGGSPDYVLVEGATSIDDGNWHYLSAVYDGSNVLLYVDGRLDALPSALTGALSSSVHTFQVGSCSTNPIYTNGSIDEVRVYSRALSTDEVKRLYNLKKPKVAAGLNNTGLVGYWSFNEGLGTVATDFSGNKNNGTLSGANGLPTWINGKRGNALNFDGVDDVVNLPDLRASFTNQVSVSAWVNDTVAGSYSMVFSAARTDGDGSEGFELRTFDTGGKPQFSVDTTVGGRPTALSSGSSIVNTGWHHLVGTYDGTTISIYVDGVLSGTSTSGSGNIEFGAAGSIWKIGQRGTSGCSPCAFPYTGSIDEVRIYNRALTATDVYALYKSTYTKINSPQNNQLTGGLVGMWSFNGKDLTTSSARDSSRNGNDGALTGDPVPAIGKVGQALKFDGVDDYVVSGSSVDVPGDMSVFAWVFSKSDACPGGACGIFSSVGITQFGLWSGFGGVDRVLWDNTIVHSFPSTISLNVWHHIGFTRTGTTGDWTSRGYVDGVLVGTQTGITTNPGVANAAILGSFQSNQGFFNGIIDEVRIYNRALSSDEVKQLYNMGK